MAQTGEVKYVVTAGIPSILETGEVQSQIAAGIPSAYTAAGVTGNPWYYYAQMLMVLALGTESIELAIKFLEYIEVNYA